MRALLTLLLLGAQACFNPQYGDESFSCAREECPSGYDCVSRPGRGKVCVRQGMADARVGDGVLAPDAPPGAPGIDLTSPANGWAASHYKVTFKFNVSVGSAAVMWCQAFLGKDVVWTRNNPQPGPLSFLYDKVPLAAGSHGWRVVCRGTDGKERTSPTWSFTVKPEQLGKCQAGGFKPDRRYALSADLKASSGDCLVIDAPGVLLDGKGRVIRGAAFKDAVYHASSAEPFTVLENRDGGPSWKAGWVSPFKAEANWDRPSATDFDFDGLLDFEETLEALCVDGW